MQPTAGGLPDSPIAPMSPPMPGPTPVERPVAPARSRKPLWIGLFVLVAAAGAAYYFSRSGGGGGAPIQVPTVVAQVGSVQRTLRISGSLKATNEAA